jgi:uncharacterized protein (DUF305 family)
MKRFALISVLAIGALSLTGCATDHSGHEPMASQSVYTSGDLMFAQMMIPHHQQAVVMSGFAEGKTTNTDILHIASHIKGAQEPEIKQMKSWLTDSGTSLMDHNMTMDGMLTNAEMTELEASTGAEFEKLYLTGMIKHHQGAIDMLSMISSSTNPEVVTLRENIRKTQTAEIKQMQDLLKKY